MPMLTLDTKNILFTAKVIFLCTLIFASGAFFSHELPIFLTNDPSFALNEFAAPLPRVIGKSLSDNAVMYFRPGDAIATRDDFIRMQKDFLFADLSQMSLSLFRHGEAIKTFPIKAKARAGSFFEVPSGIFTLQIKEKKHFSSIDEVWMPWSMGFFGNYSIHGIPQYQSNKPVPDTFTGGCIRLTTEDAQELFALSAIDMPVLVSSPDSALPTQANYFQKISPAAQQAQIIRDIPRLSAISAIAADFETGQILFEKNAEQVHPIASLTKLMTAIIAVENVNPLALLTVDTQAEDTFGNTGKLAIGEVFSAKDLMYPLILESSNDAATLYTEHVNGFVDMMNKKAAVLGLAHTHFFDPTGLTPNNASNAQDLFKLLSYISVHNRPLFALSSLPEYMFTSNKKTHIWKNTTWPDTAGNIFIGGKSGFTDEAHQTLAAVFRVRLSEQQDHPLAIILLGSRDRKRDAKIIMDYLQKNIVFGNTLVREKNDPFPTLVNTEASVFQSLQGLGTRIK